MNSTREIILVVSDEKGKNILFILDNLQALTLEEAIKKTEKGEISGAHLVECPTGIYLRANPKDKRLTPENISKTPKRYLCKYLDNPKHSICFAAGKINQIRKDFSSEFEADKPEIIGDLYSGTIPLSSSQATKRGKQIAAEFYNIATKVLK